MAGIVEFGLAAGCVTVADVAFKIIIAIHKEYKNWNLAPKIVEDVLSELTSTQQFFLHIDNVQNLQGIYYDAEQPVWSELRSKVSDVQTKLEKMREKLEAGLPGPKDSTWTKMTKRKKLGSELGSHGELDRFRRSLETKRKEVVEHLQLAGIRFTRQVMKQSKSNHETIIYRIDQSIHLIEKKVTQTERTLSRQITSSQQRTAEEGRATRNVLGQRFDSLTQDIAGLSTKDGYATADRALGNICKKAAPALTLKDVNLPPGETRQVMGFVEDFIEGVIQQSLKHDPTGNFLKGWGKYTDPITGKKRDIMTEELRDILRTIFADVRAVEMGLNAAQKFRSREEEYNKTITVVNQKTNLNIDTNAFNFQLYKEDIFLESESDLLEREQEQYLRMILSQRDQGYSTVVVLKALRTVAGFIVSVFFQNKLPADSEIVRAIRAGDVQWLSLLLDGNKATLEDRIDTNGVVRGSYSLFELATLLNKPAIMRYLLTKKAEVNAGGFQQGPIDYITNMTNVSKEEKEHLMDILLSDEKININPLLTPDTILNCAYSLTQTQWPKFLTVTSRFWNINQFITWDDGLLTSTLLYKVLTGSQILTAIHNNQSGHHTDTKTLVSSLLQHGADPTLTASNSTTIFHGILNLGGFQNRTFEPYTMHYLFPDLIAWLLKVDRRFHQCLTTKVYMGLAEQWTPSDLAYNSRYTTRNGVKRCMWPIWLKAIKMAGLDIRQVVGNSTEVTRMAVWGYDWRSCPCGDCPEPGPEESEAHFMQAWKQRECNEEALFAEANVGRPTLKAKVRPSAR